MPNARPTAAPMPAPISWPRINRSVAKRITSGICTTELICAPAGKPPGDVYQAIAGGTMNEATTAPMIAPASARMRVVFTIEGDCFYHTGPTISSQLSKMAEHEPDSVPPANEMNTISLDGRLLSIADLYAVAARPDVTRIRIYALKQNLGPLATLTSLRHLELTDPHVLDGLEG